MKFASVEAWTTELSHRGMPQPNPQSPATEIAGEFYDFAEQHPDCFAADVLPDTPRHADLPFRSVPIIAPVGEQNAGENAQLLGLRVNVYEPDIAVQSSVGQALPYGRRGVVPVGDLLDSLDNPEQAATLKSEFSLVWHAFHTHRYTDAASVVFDGAVANARSLPPPDEQRSWEEVIEALRIETATEPEQPIVLKSLDYGVIVDDYRRPDGSISYQLRDKVFEFGDLEFQLDVVLPGTIFELPPGEWHHSDNLSHDATVTAQVFKEVNPASVPFSKLPHGSFVELPAHYLGLGDGMNHIRSMYAENDRDWRPGLERKFSGILAGIERVVRPDQSFVEEYGSTSHGWDIATDLTPFIAAACQFGGTSTAEYQDFLTKAWRGEINLTTY